MKRHSFVRRLAAVLLASLGAMSSVTSAHASIPAAESQALIDLYNGTGGASWANKTNWINAVGAECTWFGVTCDAGQTHVIALQLPANHLIGPLSALGALSQLQTLNLSSNTVTGNSTALAGLGELRTLTLNSVDLTGPLPTLTDFPHLVTFNAISSTFSGALPDFSGMQ